MLSDVKQMLSFEQFEDSRMLLLLFVDFENQEHLRSLGIRWPNFSLAKSKSRYPQYIAFLLQLVDEKKVSQGYSAWNLLAIRWPMHLFYYVLHVNSMFVLQQSFSKLCLPQPRLQILDCLINQITWRLPKDSGLWLWSSLAVIFGLDQLDGLIIWAVVKHQYRTALGTNRRHDWL